MDFGWALIDEVLDRSLGCGSVWFASTEKAERWGKGKFWKGSKVSLILYLSELKFLA